MSRPLLRQARQVVRLRDVRFDAAVEAFETALAQMRQAEDALDRAHAAVEAANTAALDARRALAEHPDEAPARLALLDAAAAQAIMCEEARAAAQQARDEAARQLDDARAVMLVARARLEAMSSRAQALSAGIARQDEEAAALENEERVVSGLGGNG